MIIIMRKQFYIGTIIKPRALYIGTTAAIIQLNYVKIQELFR